MEMELVALSLASWKYEILHLETETFLNEFLHRLQVHIVEHL